MEHLLGPRSRGGLWNCLVDQKLYGESTVLPEHQPMGCKPRGRVDCCIVRENDALQQQVPVHSLVHSLQACQAVNQRLIHSLADTVPLRVIGSRSLFTDPPHQTHILKQSGLERGALIAQ